MAQFDTYGRMAKASLSDTSQNGRYTIQKDAERLIPDDVMRKLAIEKNDRFLDVGCGMGVNLLPIAAIAAHAAGCDHPAIIERLKQKPQTGNIDFYTGDFLTTNFEKPYTKILIYSVLHTLPDSDILYAFLDKAMSILAKNGLMLLGDIPNKDLKNRFLTSERGQAFQKEWEALSANAPEEASIADFMDAQDSHTVTFDDILMMDILAYCRKKGFHSYAMPQPHNLPFGNTREDILIIGPEYTP